MTIKEMMKEFIVNKMNGKSTGLVDYINEKTKELNEEDIKIILDEDGVCYEHNDNRQELIQHMFGQLNWLLGRKILSILVLKGQVSQKELYKTIYVREYLYGFGVKHS